MFVGIGITAESISSSENVDTNSALNDDVLHDMLSMASQLDEPTVDFVGAVTPTVVARTPTSEPHQEKKNGARRFLESPSLCLLSVYNFNFVFSSHFRVR